MTRAQLIAPTSPDRWPHPPKPAPFGWKFWRPPPPPRPKPPRPTRVKRLTPVLRDVVPPEQGGITHRAILDKGAEMFGITPAYLVCGCKADRNRVNARRVVVALLRVHCRGGLRLSFPEIAEMISGRRKCHSTAQTTLVAWAHDAELVGLSIRLASQLGLDYATELNELAAWAQHYRTYRAPKG